MNLNASFSLKMSILTDVGAWTEAADIWTPCPVQALSSLQPHWPTREPHFYTLYFAPVLSVLDVRVPTNMSVYLNSEKND